MGSDSSLINITPVADTSLTRVTGIGFELGSLRSGRRAITIYGKATTSFIPTKIRIDNNRITGGSDSVMTYGRVYGVIDHNTFTNCYSGVFGWGKTYDNQAWIDAYNAGGIFAGTANAMFVEDNNLFIPLLRKRSYS